MAKQTSLVVLAVLMVLFSGLAYGQPNDQSNLGTGSIGGPVQAGQGGQSPEATEQPKAGPESSSGTQSGPQEVRIGGTLNVHLTGLPQAPKAGGGHHRKSSGARSSAPVPKSDPSTRIDNLNIYAYPQGTASSPTPAVSSPPASPGTPSETPAKSEVKENSMINWTAVLIAAALVIGAVVVIPTIYSFMRKSEEERTARQKSTTHRELATLALGNQKTALGDGDEDGDNVPMDVTVFESGTVVASTRRRRATPRAAQIYGIAPPVQTLVVSAPGQINVIPLNQATVQPGDGARRQAEADEARRRQADADAAAARPDEPPVRPAAQPAVDVDPGAAAERGAAA